MALPALLQDTMTEPFLFKASARLVDFMRQADEPGLINLAAGIPGLDALPKAALAQALQNAVSKEGARLFAYHHPEGDHPLRELLADRLRSRGASVRGPELFTTTGCTQGLSVLLSVLVRPGDVVACEAPAYYGLLEILSEAGARILPLAVRDAGGIDLDAAEESLARWRPRCLVVCSSLSNPSGATLSEAARRRLVEICRRLGVRIIEDDIYGELEDGGAPKPLLAFDGGGETVSYVSSFSKSVAPGLRVGVCVPGTLFDQATARKTQQDLHSAVPTEVVLREFLAQGVLDPHLAGLRQRNARRRTLALDAVARSFPQGSRVDAPTGGYMLWVRLPQRIDFAQARVLARRENVAFAGGDVFFAEPAAQSCVRLNCAKASEEDLVRGIEILGAVLGSLGEASDR
jgi:2-aminoadipate transaminase